MEGQYRNKNARVISFQGMLRNWTLTSFKIWFLFFIILIGVCSQKRARRNLEITPSRFQEEESHRKRFGGAWAHKAKGHIEGA